jgi:hypothetical protein
MLNKDKYFEDEKAIKIFQKKKLNLGNLFND